MIENINEIFDGQPEEIECFICSRDFQPDRVGEPQRQLDAWMFGHPVCQECKKGTTKVINRIKELKKGKNDS